MQAPSAKILPQVWWSLSPEERGKHVWLHTLLGSILCPAWPSFVSGREGWGQPNHLWFGSQGWPRESLGGDLFCLGVMRWQAGAFQSWLHSIYFFFVVKGLEEAGRCSGVITRTLPSFCPERAAHRRKSPNTQSGLPQGLVSLLCHGLPPWAATPFILPAGASHLIHT